LVVWNQAKTPTLQFFPAIHSVLLQFVNELMLMANWLTGGSRRFLYTIAKNNLGKTVK